MTRKQLSATLSFFLGVIVLMGGGAWLQNNFEQVGLGDLLVMVAPTPTPSLTPQVLSQHIEPAQVVRVIDGDTIELSTGQKVRYIGIDTPETVHPQKAVQCFGKAASAENKRLVENKTVYLIKDVSETDRYGRLLRYVYLSPEASESGMVNALLIKGGFAKSSSYPPDVSQQKMFQKLESEARSVALGLWSSECQTP
jgi:micrococcal nuclease